MSNCCSKMKNLNIKTVLIAILLVVVLAYQVKDCSNDPNVGGTTTIKIDTVYKEIKTETKVYVPKWRTKVETIEVPYQVGNSQPIDTTEILKDYFAKYVTIDTVKLPYGDSLPTKTFGTAIITDTISKNAIMARHIRWNYRIPTITKTITVYPPSKTQVFIGAQANINNVQILSNLAGSVLLKTKKDRVYMANIGIANNGMGGVQPFIGGGVFWKIQLRKPKPTDLLKITQ